MNHARMTGLPLSTLWHRTTLAHLANMASSENPQQLTSPAPPSLSAGGHETRDYYAAQDATRPPSHDDPYLTPYLGLRARLSQTWINKWTVLLLLVLVRTLFAIASLDDNLGSARREALSACNSVENVGSAMASMPHYMSQGVNEMTAKGIERAINGLMQMLILTVTGVEEIVLFVINLLTSTYVCLITLAVSGSLHVAVKVAEDVGDFLNSTVKSIGDDLGSATKDFQNVLNDFVGGLEKVGDFFTGKKSTPPTIDLSKEINALNGIQLPAGYDQGLEKFNSSIPTFADVQNFTETAIKWPFEEVKKLLNESLPKYTMNRSLFPVPAKEQLTFCSDSNGINGFFDDLVQLARDAKMAFLWTIVILALCAMAPMAYRELRRYRFMKQRAELIQSDGRDPMDSVYLVSRPYSSSTGLWLADKFSSPRRQALVRWTVAYATTVPALFVLSLALAGLASCLCQYILLKAVEKEVPALENEVINFADKVILSLNNASEQWAIGTNKVILDTNNDINHDVFGWVNTTTHAVNSTLNTFVDEMMKGLNITFGGTVLYEPILEVLNCLVLLKIEGIEKGLTWVSNHAHVDFPLLQNDTFSLGTLQKVSGSDTDMLATDSNGTAAQAVTGAVVHVTDVLAKAIRQEALIATSLLIVWIIIAVIGVGRSLFLFYKGGDEGVYPTPAPGKPVARSSFSSEKYELDEFHAAGVPSYEQATGQASRGDHGAARFNGQEYTLRPTPVPTMEVTGASPIMNTGFSSQEKVGTVNGQYVDSAIRRPTHIRASSHGDYAVTSPTSPPRPNPFLSPNEMKDPKHNPFADSGR